MDPNNNNGDNNNHAVNDDDEAVAEVLQFNLTNPDELSHQLEQANLDDEETELLFQEAMKLNAQLKEALRHQQLEEHSSSGGQGKSDKLRREHQPHSQSHPLAEQFVHRKPRKACLPPITASLSDKNRDRSEAKSGKTRVSSDVGTSQRISSGHRRKGSAKKTAVDKRPAWDDRFSYS